MKHLIIVFIVLTSLSGFSQNDNQSEVSVYYFIRHAEKDRSDATNKNPHLTRKGLARANNWSDILDDVKFDKVYSTDYNRTKETAQPTATKNKLKLTLYHPFKLKKEIFLKDTKGKTVLVVGHSNTTPEFVNLLLGNKKYKHIDDTNNGNLYIITIIDDKISDQVLTIN